MKLSIVKTFMTEPRYHFDRTLELAKYMEVQWFCGWMLHSHYTFEDYEDTTHKIRVLGKGPVRGKLKGLWIEFKFVLQVIKGLKQTKSDVVMVHSSRLAFLYPILAPGHNYVLMLFTTSVSPSKLRNFFWDSWEQLVMLPYKQYIIGTPEMQDLFGLQHKKCYVRRWGMKPLTQKNKSFSTLKLMYIGVLSGRRVHETIEGLKLFMDIHPEVEVSYSIIGRGKDEYVKLITQAIKEYNLEEVVAYHGYLPDSEIGAFFEECNVGVSYVPITPYYTDVIVTKTVEYLLSGLAVIATNTNKNRDDINDTNGVLIEDSPASFAQGLEKIYNRLGSYDSDVIRKSAKRWNLEDNVRDNLAPMFKEIARQAKE